MQPRTPKLNPALRCCSSCMGLLFLFGMSQQAHAQGVPPYHSNPPAEGVQQASHSVSAQPTWVNTRPAANAVQATYPNTPATQQLAGQASGTQSQANVASSLPSQPSVTRSRTPLPPPSSDQEEADAGSTTLGTLLSVFSSLSVVVGLFLGLAWVLRRTGVGGNQSVPNEVLQVLGRTNVGPKHQMLLIQFGPKLVLASLHQGEMRVLSEISEPAQVQSMLADCGATLQHESVGYSDTKPATGFEQIKQFATGLLTASGSGSNKESRSAKPGYFEQGA